MNAAPITQIGDPVLRQKSHPIEGIPAKDLSKLIQTLRTSMHDASLIGIAAPQIGLPLQIFVTEIRKTKKRDTKDTSPFKVFINPKIIERSKKHTEMDEGCGSLCEATLYGPVKRPESVTVEALDENFQPFTLKASGLLAKCIQHEYDHLQGVLIIDKFIDTKRCWSTQ